LYLVRIFSRTVLFVGISHVIGCEYRLQSDLDCVGWGVNLFSSCLISTAKYQPDFPQVYFVNFSYKCGLLAELYWFLSAKYLFGWCSISCYKKC